MANIGDLMTRTYGNFRGIDLLNPPNSVDLSRSPDCLNVWKSYSDTQSNIIQTRPGLTKLVNLGNEAIYSLYVFRNDIALVHIGTKLIKWVGFPSDKISVQVLKSDMRDNKSIMLFFNDYIYILDGSHFLKFDGTKLINLVNEAYIPTTTISRSPSGGGERFEDINLLSSKRKNSFLADGTSTEYVLDATTIDSVDKVWINDILVTDYTINKNLGKVIFNTAPEKPTLIGKDNVVVEFTKEVQGYKERIEKATIACVFDNRIFFSGNKEFGNAVFHCSLNNPAYVSDLDYYECGSQDNQIKSLVVGNNLLWVLKEENQNKDTIFYLTPTTDAEYGRIYPRKQGNLTVGCYAGAINFKDNILFLSRNGLEGINSNIEYEQSVSHKSSLVDSRMTKMSNYMFCNIADYNDYLMIAIDNVVFLADSRAKYHGTKGTEYEWFVWKFPYNISMLKNYLGKLYIADDNGNLYVLEGTNDNEQIIKSYWNTPRDDFGYMNHLKTINKRGSIIKIKSQANGKVKISEQTNNNENWKLLKEASSSGFDFNNVDFQNFSFISADSAYIVFRVKEKKIIDISIKVFSDELNKPFGLDSIVIEAYLGGYVKRS